MRISVFGLGYVGAVSAACLSRDGHYVVGVDPDPMKVRHIGAGQSPVVERGLGDLINAGVRARRLSATSSWHDAVASTDVAVICVGTPSRPDGDIDLTFVQQAAEQIGLALRERRAPFLVVLRSTMLPGSTRDVVIPTLAASSGRPLGDGYEVSVYPEFLREGTAVDDYTRPAKVVIGSDDKTAGDTVESIVPQSSAPVFRTTIGEAELSKYADNYWHALKVAFANEVGVIAKHAGIDGERLMELFCQDRKLNLSPAYLRPGLPFGGSCLAKDVRALIRHGAGSELDLPVLGAVLASNRRHLDRAVDLVVQAAAGERRVGVMGLCFKAGTDDMRESPMVEVAERLIRAGYDLRIYDRNVDIAQATEANRAYIRRRIPEIDRLLVPTLEQALDHAMTVVVGTEDQGVTDAVLATGEPRRIVDLVRIVDWTSDGTAYNGICW